MIARHSRTALLCALVLGGVVEAAHGQERPYFVSYTDRLEKAGELEVSALSTIGDVKDGPNYFAPWIEIEYGITGRWTTEVYIEGVTIHKDASAFTGWRWENRFRPFAGEHRVNPVLYVEYESLNEASRIQKEIVGEGAPSRDPLGSLVHKHARELEGRLILSTQLADWEIAGNAIVEKNLSEDEGFEYGYAGGATRRFRQFSAGLEVYGGLGASAAEFEQTRHFVAPVVAFRLPRGSVVKASVGFGVTGASERYLVRIGYSVDLW
jgi:hypothetical protein